MVPIIFWGLQQTKGKLICFFKDIASILMDDW